MFPRNPGAGGSARGEWRARRTLRGSIRNLDPQRSPKMIRFARSACATLAVAAMLCSATHAAAPLVKSPAPGFYRMMVGDFEVTPLSDGTAGLPMGTLLTNVTPAEVKKDFARSFIKDPVETSVNAFLVNTG